MLDGGLRLSCSQLEREDQWWILLYSNPQAEKTGLTIRYLRHPDCKYLANTSRIVSPSFMWEKKLPPLFLLSLGLGSVIEVMEMGAHKQVWFMLADLGFSLLYFAQELEQISYTT